MEHTEIGASSIRTSRIGLSTRPLGWMGAGADERQAIDTILAAVDRGMTLLDTAPAYGYGRSEEIVGKALKEGRLRDKVQVATKAGLSWTGAGLFRDSRPTRLRQEVEDSLRRLQTDVIELYQIHWPDPETPFEETARALEDLQRHGKILSIGVGNHSREQMDVFRSAARLDAVRPPYNLFEREIEADVLPCAKLDSLTVLSYRALCRGLLSGGIGCGTLREGAGLRANDPGLSGPQFQACLAAVRDLGALARDRYGKSVLALAVRWVLDKGPTIALWDACRPAQLESVEDVFGWHIDEAGMREIDRILSMHLREPVAPCFIAPPGRRHANPS